MIIFLKTINKLYPHMQKILIFVNKAYIISQVGLPEVNMGLMVAFMLMGK